MITIKVIINGVAKYVPMKPMTYEDLVELAGEDPARVFSVTYSGRPKGDSRRSGEMHHGKAPLELEEGMVISVMDTSNA